GQLVSTRTYDAFGSFTGTGSDDVPLGFAGLVWDADVGLYYARARWYDPQVGRFLSPDPGMIEAGRSAYEYAGNNPLRFRDPGGQTLNDTVLTNERPRQPEVDYFEYFEQADVDTRNEAINWWL